MELSCALQDVEQHFGLNPLDASSFSNEYKNSTNLQLNILLGDSSAKRVKDRKISEYAFFISLVDKA